MMKQFCFRFLVMIVAIVSLSSSVVFAETKQTTTTPKQWSLPAFGEYTIPNELHIAYIPDVSTFIKDKNKISPDAATQVLDKIIPPGALNAAPFVMGLFQLTHYDGQDYRQAYAFTLKFNQPAAELLPFFMGSPDAEKRKQAKAMEVQVKEKMAGVSYINPETRQGGTILEVSDLQIFPVSTNRTGYSGGARYLIQFEDFQFPFYVHGYSTADENGAPVVVAMIFTDFERKFWLNLMDSMLIPHNS